jgi:monoamine oxidase
MIAFVLVPPMNSPQKFTRRAVLKTSGLALLASGGLAASAPQRAKSVIVAGGGIGGLCCAYELMERGIEVTVLEASRRTGGHVKTIRDPLPDGLYADVGAEHFTQPGYEEYWRYVRKFDLPYLPWKRRENMYRKIEGKWFTEQQLANPKVVAGFGFAPRETDHIVAHGWPDLATLYFGPYLEKFTDQFQPFGIGLDHLDAVTLGDFLAQEGASPTAIRFIGGRVSTPDKPATGNDVSALFRLWQAAIMKLRGIPSFNRHTFHLEGGNQVLPDTFAARLGERVRKHCALTAIEHDSSGVKVSFSENGGAPQSLGADYLVVSFSPLLLTGIKVTPEWPAEKAYAINHVKIGMQSRVLLQAKTRFWQGDVPSINLETGDGRMSLVYETAADVPGEKCVLMGSGQPVETPEEALAAFRAFYPGKAQDTIEQCIVHQWWKEEPTCFGCERLAFPLGELRKFWPHLATPVGRIYFAGSAYDCTPHGQDAATRTANRVAEAIAAAG